MTTKGMLTFILLIISSIASARDIHLANQTKRICIGQSQRLWQARNQLAVLAVNGRSSRQSTFWYSGRHSRLTLDFHTANVHAQCNRRGGDIYNFIFAHAFNDPNRYHLRYRVDCVPCGSEVISQAKQSIIKKIHILKDLPRGGKYQILKKQLLKDAQKLKALIENELERTSPNERRKLLNILDNLEKIVQLVLEDAIHSELFQYYLDRFLRN